MMQANLTSIRPYFKIGLVLIFVIFVIIGSLIISSLGEDINVTRPNQEESKPSITPTKLKQPRNFQSELENITSILPYKGQNYSINYRSALNTLEVEIDGNDRENYLTTKIEVENFLKSRGVSDLCVLNIFWQTPENSSLYKELTPRDFITTDCPVSPKR